MSPARSKPTDPVIWEMPTQVMAVVVTHGDPNIVAEQALPALFGAVFTLKFARKKAGLGDFKVSGLRARWPDAHLVPKSEWTGIWALPIPNAVTVVPPKVPGIEIAVQTWEYGPVAQILHLGPYAAACDSIQRLHAFIAEQGYVIAGMHEEEYLTRPDAKVPKTLIRYPVRRVDDTE